MGFMQSKNKVALKGHQFRTPTSTPKRKSPMLMPIERALEIIYSLLTMLKIPGAILKQDRTANIQACAIVGKALQMPYRANTGHKAGLKLAILDLTRVSGPGRLGLPLCFEFLAPAGSVSHDKLTCLRKMLSPMGFRQNCLPGQKPRWLRG